MIFDVVAGIGRICEGGLVVSLFLFPPPSLSLCLSHLNGTAKWWSNLSDLWLGAGPDIIACHSRTEWGRGGWVCAAPRNTKYLPPPPVCPVFLTYLWLFLRLLFMWTQSPSCCSSHCGSLLECFPKKMLKRDPKQKKDCINFQMMILH